MNRIFPVLAAALLAVCPAFFHGCQTADGGTEIPNELRGSEVIAATGEPAADAEVRLIPVGYVPGEDSSSPLFTARTDARGRFVFEDLPPGQYNILAAEGNLRSFRDSVTVTGRVQELAADTLKAPGSLSGVVKLQPQHGPEIATVQAMGTTVFVNVSSDGSFALNGLGAGTYRLRVAVQDPGYVPLYRVVEVPAGGSRALAEPLEPHFAGTPVVTGLTATPGPGGTMTVRWDKPAFRKVQAYLIYRDSLGSLLPGNLPHRNVSDTLFVDTIYSETPGPGQYPWRDTVPRTFRYRVKILDLSGEVGPAFGFAEGTAVPPTVSHVSGLWSRALAAAPFGKRSGASLTVFQDRLWLFGGSPNREGVADAWSSRDGTDWRKVSDSLPFGSYIRDLKAVVFREELWIMGTRPVSDGYENFLWKSPDGSAWTRVADPLPVTGTSEFGLAAFQDRLWRIWGSSHTGFGGTGIWSSEDGKSWSPAEGAPPSTSTSRMGVAELAGTLHVIGGDHMPWFGAEGAAWRTRDGKAWQVDTPASILPRYRFACLAHAGKLWILGGAYGSGDPRADEVWSSPDGESWTLVDAHAPFGLRTDMAAASFKGRIWAIGGKTLDASADHDDVWSMHAP